MHSPYSTSDDVDDTYDIVLLLCHVKLRTKEILYRASCSPQNDRLKMFPTK